MTVHRGTGPDRAHLRPGRLRSATPLGILLSLSLIAGLLYGWSLPAAAAEPATGPQRPAAGSGSAPQEAGEQRVILLRAASEAGISQFDKDTAAAVIADLVAEQEALRQEQVRSQQAWARQVALARQANRVRRAQAEANAQLQKALEALAKALSTSQCKSVGGTNGEPASISCPLAEGGEGEVEVGTPGATPTPPPPTPP